MSATICARVPDSLKQALEAQAAERGLTLTSALVELVERGFEGATVDNLRELRGRRNCL